MSEIWLDTSDIGHNVGSRLVCEPSPANKGMSPAGSHSTGAIIPTPFCTSRRHSDHCCTSSAASGRDTDK